MFRRSMTACLFCAVILLSCRPSTQTPDSGEARADPELAAFIAGVRAVDNHTHVGSVAAGDADTDALPLDGLPAFDLPSRLQPDSPVWLTAYRGLYRYAYSDLSEAHRSELRDSMKRVAAEQGEKYPEWVLDKVGTEVMFANRIAMGPGLNAPRFRWVSYVDALMVPLNNTAEAAVNPDRANLYPLEDKLLRRYLGDLGLSGLPATLDEYLSKVVTGTLERQKQAGCVAVKFEAAYLRALDFGDSDPAAAARVYARYLSGGIPAREEYKTLQDYLFRYIAREAGRLGMAVHIHSAEGAGGFYSAAGSDPLLLEPSFNDASLRKTNFVIIHGGGMYADHAAAMMWKPNVYADISLIDLMYPPAKLAAMLRNWLEQFPQKILFATDASAFGPDLSWDIVAWNGAANARNALGIALSGMMRDGEISRERANEIAVLVLRGNANRLYNLGLK